MIRVWDYFTVLPVAANNLGYIQEKPGVMNLPKGLYSILYSNIFIFYDEINVSVISQLPLIRSCLSVFIAILVLFFLA